MEFDTNNFNIFLCHFITQHHDMHYAISPLTKLIKSNLNVSHFLFNTLCDCFHFTSGFIRYDFDDCKVDADKFCCFRNSPHFSCFLLLIQVDSGCQCSIFYSVATWHRFLLKNISICHLIVNTFFEISLPRWREKNMCTNHIKYTSTWHMKFKY